MSKYPSMPGPGCLRSGCSTWPRSAWRCTDTQALMAIRTSTPYGEASRWLPRRFLILFSPSMPSLVERQGRTNLTLWLAVGVTAHDAGHALSQSLGDVQDK